MWRTIFRFIWVVNCNTLIDIEMWVSEAYQMLKKQ